MGEALAYNELLEDAAPVTQQARLLRQQQQQQQSFWEAQQQSRVNESTSSDEVVIVQSTKATPAAVIDDDDYDSQMEKQRQMNEIARAYAELTVKYPDEVPEEYARVAVMLESYPSTTQSLFAVGQPAQCGKFHNLPSVLFSFLTDRAVNTLSRNPFLCPSRNHKRRLL